MYVVIFLIIEGFLYWFTTMALENNWFSKLKRSKKNGVENQVGIVTTRVEFGAVTPRVPWFGGTGLVSDAPQGWFNPRLRPKDFA